MDKRVRGFLDRCINMGVIPIFGKIDEKTTREIEYVMSQLSQREIETVYFALSSESGDDTEASRIFDLIKQYPGEKIGIVCGRAFSSAVIILQAFDHKLATSDSRFLINTQGDKIVSITEAIRLRIVDGIWIRKLPWEQKKEKADGRFSAH